MIISESHLRRVIQEVMLAEYSMGSIGMSDSPAAKRAGKALSKAYKDSEKKRKKTSLDKVRKKTGHMSAYGAAAAAKISKPSPKKSAITMTNVAKVVMWNENRKKLKETLERFESSVGDENKKELSKLKAGIKSGLVTGAEQWVKLANMTDKRTAGEIMGVRLQWRQDMVDKTLAVIKSAIQAAAELIYNTMKKAANVWDEIVKIWKSVPSEIKGLAGNLSGSTSKIQNLSKVVLTRSGMIAAAAGFIIEYFGKKLLKVGNVLLIITAISSIFKLSGFLSTMSDMADKLTGDDSVSLKYQFIPSNLKKGTAKKGYAGLAQGILGDQKSTAAGYAAMKKAMGRD